MPKNNSVWMRGLLFGVAIWGAQSQVYAGAEPVRVAQAAPAADANMDMLLKGVSDKEKLRFSQDALDELRSVSTGIQKKVEEARKRKDIVLLNCLNEKLSSQMSLQKVAETAAVLMREAISQNSGPQAEHQFRKIVIARYKARQLVLESNECVGDETQEGSTSEASVTVDSALEGTVNTTQDPGDTIDNYTPVELPPTSS